MKIIGLVKGDARTECWNSARDLVMIDFIKGLPKGGSFRLQYLLLQKTCGYLCVVQFGILAVLPHEHIMAAFF
jgi:hypothetical protein